MIRMERLGVSGEMFIGEPMVDGGIENKIGTGVNVVGGALSMFSCSIAA